MGGTSFTIKFLSNTAPTQTVNFTIDGNCDAASLAQNGSASSTATTVTIPVENQGDLLAEFTQLAVSSNITASTAYLDLVTVGGSTAWQANDANCGSVSRVKIDNTTGTVFFTSCSYNNPSITGGSTSNLGLNIGKYIQSR